MGLCRRVRLCCWSRCSSVYTQTSPVHQPSRSAADYIGLAGARHVCATLCRDPEQKKPKGEGPVGNTISDPVMLDRYVAIADYVKQETNQCSLEAGQVVEVVEKNQHGRWAGPGGGGHISVAVCIHIYIAAHCFGSV